SSGGGLQASQLQVFALGASKTESKAPTLPAARTTQGVVRASAPAAPAFHGVASVQTALGPGHLVTGKALVVKPWNANSSNWEDTQGRLLVGRTPVVGAKISVDDYVLPAATGKDGSLPYPADITIPGRHVVRVVDASKSKAGGQAVPAAALTRLTAGFSVGYGITD